ncbi:MAG: inositol monophosphatase [Gammaproteobacteria bacterium]|jgi:myo-inositol-1(or 4)-monophosphatase|nr:inositol monophosphatase [Gammaproteobacteria bacterium]MBT3859411.1 inositol monophosphatase [Gammaproteobacteria bacterium]MBT3988173.1 inositol monophosphatase [Gammaproteobacteria bacterium]MBT4257437.1 inositol monophosphatase [Gammaproteobacteria bacterium]MBT4583362.1 inositol monophosphatase [Gammaproteobacteria bacterium]
MLPLVNIALQAARDAAEALAHSSDRLDRVKVINNDPAEFLTSMDLASEKTILYHLEKAYPDHSFHSRASGLKQGKSGEPTWLIDPLLGNMNFAGGYPQFAVSVACQIDGVVQHAVVISPLVREEYTASRGRGTQLNSRRLRVGQATEISDCLISLDGDIADEVAVSMHREIMAANARPRISGCTPLDILNTACNRTQGGWAQTEPACSLAAVNLILQEAGGLIGSESGSPDLSSASELIFGNPKTFKQLTQIRSGL